VSSDPGGQEPQAHEPIEIDPSDPSGRVQTIQRLVYYISEVIHDAKTRYLKVHKLLYAVLIASRKLCHYFQAHKILVVTSYPLKVVLHNPNATRNIAKWAAEMAEFKLDFLPCHTVKSQVLADFMEDWTPPPCDPGGPDDSKSEAKAPVFIEPHWMLFFDGPSHKQGAGAGVLLLTPNGGGSSTWCISSSRPQTTWHSMRPSCLGYVSRYLLGFGSC
jgi:hypothetical protein